MEVGFIGLGQMGIGMAGNLLKAGHDLRVYNRTPEKAKPLEADGAQLAATPAQAADGADVVITMVADDDALESIVLGETGLLAGQGKGTIHISASTISVALSQRLTEAHAAAGQTFVSAPVFGRPDAAATARLAIVAAGPADAVALCKPLFEAMGQRLFVIGTEPQTANLVKLSGNFLIASVIESLGEAIALVGKAGVDRHDYVELLTSTLFGAPVYKTYGGLIAERKFEPAGFAAKLGLKDIRLALAAGEAMKVPLPVASLLRDRLLALLADGGQDLDWAAVSTLAARDSGQAS
jgi:3-hydroxyisobutyrate dehydrogenase-like beta-hydroxyacid dehydrogenase